MGLNTAHWQLFWAAWTLRTLNCQGTLEGVLWSVIASLPTPKRFAQLITYSVLTL
jgi:hypothetical protein